MHLNVHVFQLSEEGAADDDETEESVSIYREWMLPAREFHNLWDSLLYEGDIKARLLHYASTVRQSCPKYFAVETSLTRQQYISGRTDKVFCERRLCYSVRRE